MNALISSVESFLTSFVLLTNTAADVSEKARILGFDQQLLIQTGIHIITSLLLFAFLGKMLFKPVKEILAKRKQGIADEYETLKKETEAASVLRKGYELKIAEVKKEADEILAQARQAAIAQENKILHEARQEADRIHARATLAIEREREKAREDIRQEIIEVATMMASKFVAASMTDLTKNELFEKAINEMGEETWLN